MNKLEIRYQEADLSDVLRHFVEGFTPRDGGKIESAEWFVDVAKGRVVFKLYVRETEGTDQ